VTDALDRDVRLHVMQRFVADGEPPTAEATGAALGIGAPEAEAAYRRLESARVLVLAPGTSDVWMAPPFCAVPTAFWVETARGGRWGTCIWDALGIPAMLGEDGVVSTTCGDCGESMELRVEAGRLLPVDGVAHFAVPARRWWQNIGYT
jgi:Alkylmercury lyase